MSLAGLGLLAAALYLGLIEVTLWRREQHGAGQDQWLAAPMRPARPWPPRSIFHFYNGAMGTDH
jgi:hypothetical protein